MLCGEPAISREDIMRVVGLKTEQLDSPLGLEAQRPRLSWRLESDRPGARQSAYRVRVADSPEALAAGGAHWDSGKVASDRCFDVAYDGPPLVSRQRCWWSVDVWDETGAPVDAPAPAVWEMGLISPDDWTARWLAVESEEDLADREARLNWVWGEEAAEAPVRRFRRRFELAEAAQATLIVGARDRVSALALDGAPVALPPVGAHAFSRPPVTRYELGALAAGPHLLAAEVAVAPRPNDPRPLRGAFSALLKLRRADGLLQRIVTCPEWRTSADEASGWAEPQFDESAWEAAAPSVVNMGQAWPPTAAMLLRKPFDVAKPLVRARLYVTALGAYEA